MDFLTNLVEVVNNYLWNYVLLFLLVGTGVYFSVRLRFIQVRTLGAGLKHTFGGLTLHGEKADHEGMSSFQALATAIAAQVGTGIIVGVAGAILTGGPGADGHCLRRPRCHLLDVGERVLWHGHQLHRGGSGPEVPQHG